MFITLTKYNTRQQCEEGTHCLGWSLGPPKFPTLNSVDVFMSNGTYPLLFPHREYSNYDNPEKKNNKKKKKTAHHFFKPINVKGYNVKSIEDKIFPACVLYMTLNRLIVRLWWMWSAPSFLLPPCPLWTRVVVPVSVPTMSQTEGFLYQFELLDSNARSYLTVSK